MEYNRGERVALVRVLVVWHDDWHTRGAGNRYGLETAFYSHVVRVHCSHDLIVMYIKVQLAVLKSCEMKNNHKLLHVL